MARLPAVQITLDRIAPAERDDRPILGLARVTIGRISGQCGNGMRVKKMNSMKNSNRGQNIPCTGARTRLAVAANMTCQLENSRLLSQHRHQGERAVRKCERWGQIYTEDKPFFSARFLLSYVRSAESDSESTPGPRDTDSFLSDVLYSSTRHRQLHLYGLSRLRWLLWPGWRIRLFLPAGI